MEALREKPDWYWHTAPVASAAELSEGFAAVAADDKTMFEIYRESDYNRSFHYIFYTDLEEHGRDGEIARAASGETVFSGFLSDDSKEDARTAVEGIVEELNDAGDEDLSMPKAEIERRLAAHLVAAPNEQAH